MPAKIEGVVSVTLTGSPDLAAQLRQRVAQIPHDCPEAVTRTLRATGEQMRIACLACREVAARFEFVAHLLDKPLPWHKES